MLGVVIILIINAGAISYEKKTGVLSQILSGKNRDKWIRNKIIHNGLFAIFITALLYTSYYYQLIKLYNLENFDASVQSLMIFEKYPFDVPIWAFIIIDFMLKAILLMAVGGIAFLVSTMSNYDVGYLATLIIIIPYFLYDLGIEFFAYISIPRYIAFMPYWMEEKYNYNLIADTLIVLVGIVSYIYAGYRLTKKRR